ncbi:UvrB/UvrC motif-containing protein [Aminomonas paucivorans]|uniref:UvrB/UvrC protein n=1 Tax=Aminomonas paucivorans DSM 12260 TaxID=584708 RepID=E3CVG2_9BACT|nr:UvrB/UvrC motif-containing protein [Aminomonas paucivorans]EFQ23218.1 UvrB/UvrC protein [Aminomonas paucivorans DSM 12260]
MLCERCGQREAEVHIKQVQGSRVEEHWLCRDCAAELGEGLPQLTLTFSFKDLLPSLGPEGKGAEVVPGIVCPRCGLTYREFRRSGLLGCPECYEAFREQLLPLLRKVQGGEVHRGERPSRLPEGLEELESLRTELQSALHDEEYERAAALRDRIRALEGGVPPVCRDPG